MSEIKHTPWTAVETRVYFAKNAGGFDLRNCPDPEEKALLCAAAPELLEALKEVLREAVILSADYLKTFRDLPDNAVIQGWDKARWKAAIAAEHKARAAIAKATGEAA